MGGRARALPLRPGRRACAAVSDGEVVYAAAGGRGARRGVRRRHVAVGGGSSRSTARIRRPRRPAAVEQGILLPLLRTDQRDARGASLVVDDAMPNGVPGAHPYYLEVVGRAPRPPPGPGGARRPLLPDRLVHPLPVAPPPRPHSPPRRRPLPPLPSGRWRPGAARAARRARAGAGCRGPRACPLSTPMRRRAPSRRVRRSRRTPRPPPRHRRARRCEGGAAAAVVAVVAAAAAAAAGGDRARHDHSLREPIDGNPADGAHDRARRTRLAGTSATSPPPRRATCASAAAAARPAARAARENGCGGRRATFRRRCRRRSRRSWRGARHGGARGRLLVLRYSQGGVLARARADAPVVVGRPLGAARAGDARLPHAGVALRPPATTGWRRGCCATTTSTRCRVRSRRRSTSPRTASASATTTAPWLAALNNEVPGRRRAEYAERLRRLRAMASCVGARRHRLPGGVADARLPAVRPRAWRLAQRHLDGDGAAERGAAIDDGGTDVLARRRPPAGPTARWSCCSARWARGSCCGAR